MSKVRIASVALIAAFGFAATSSADLSEYVLTVQANQGGAYQGVFQVPYDPAGWEGDTYTWSPDTDIEIMDGDVVIATLTQETEVSFQADPVISLNFAVQAGSDDTDFLIQSSLLSFPTIEDGEARASAGITVTDGFDGTGGTLTGGTTNGMSYLAQYNGFVPGATTYAEMISGVEAPAGGSFTQSDNEPETGFAPLAEPVSSMSAEFRFSLTANDLASGTSLFVVVPEPAGLLMLIAAAGLVRRR